MRIHYGSRGSFDRIGDRRRAASTEVGQVSSIAIFVVVLALNRQGSASSASVAPKVGHVRLEPSTAAQLVPFGTHSAKMLGTYVNGSAVYRNTWNNFWNG
jgi:hypothetical protein